MRNILVTLFLLASIQLSAQKELWKVDVSKGVFMNQLDDGKIFLKDKNEISLINNLTGEVEWEKSIAIDKDPLFLNEVPIMYFEGKSFAVVDASSGTVIAESQAKTTVLDVHYFWEKGRIIMELNRDKNLEILNIDLNDVNRSWTTRVGKVQKMLLGLAARGTKNSPSIAQDGTCVLVDKKFISFLSENGEIKNRIEFEKDIKKQGYNEFEDILYVQEDKKKLHYVDVHSGTTTFTKEFKEKKLQLEVLGQGKSLGIIQKNVCYILNAVTGESMGNHVVKDKIETVYNDAETQKYLILSKKQLKELDVLNGEVLNEKTLDTDFSKLYKVNNILLVGGRGKVNQIDISDLSTKYAKSASAPSVHNIVELKNGRVYTNHSVDKFLITAVDNTGKKNWSKEMTTEFPPSIDVIKDGLFVIDGNQANYYSIKDGKSKWKKAIETGPSFNYVVNLETDNIVMYSDKKLYFFDVGTGELVKSEDGYKFKDFDYDTQSPQLLLTDDKVFLKGSNSVYITNEKGDIQHSKHYKKSEQTSGLMKLANFAVTAAAIGTGNADEVTTVYQDNQQVYQGSMAQGINDQWEFSNELAAARQARQNMSSSGYPYVFTKLESGDRGLIFLNPSSGDEKFTVTMKEKAPNYVIDEIDGVVFYLNNSELKAIDIK